MRNSSAPQLPPSLCIPLVHPHRRGPGDFTCSRPSIRAVAARVVRARPMPVAGDCFPRPSATAVAGCLCTNCCTPRCTTFGPNPGADSSTNRAPTVGTAGDTWRGAKSDPVGTTRCHTDFHTNRGTTLRLEREPNRCTSAGTYVATPWVSVWVAVRGTARVDVRACVAGYDRIPVRPCVHSYLLRHDRVAGRVADRFYGPSSDGSTGCGCGRLCDRFGGWGHERITGPSTGRVTPRVRK